MIIDPRMPLLTQAEAAAAAGLSVKSIDNYVQHGFMIPARVERRRLFSARQIARLRLVERLTTLWHIPPATGFRAADRLLELPICKTLLARVIDVPDDENWVRATAGEEKVCLRRDADGDLEIAAISEVASDDFLSLEIAPHGFVRSVFRRCCRVLATSAAERPEENNDE